ncbi:MAG: YggS family pyridoxal phosphate-dependent enzyme [Microbacterium sp.]
MPSLPQRLAAVDERISAAARSAGRDPAEITRIVVTKFHPARLVRELFDLGVRNFGENRQQELTAKAEETSDLDGLRWHFIGQLQTKKARQVAAHASVVHSVDRDRIAQALERAARPDDHLDVLLQINLTEDAARGGAAPADILPLAERIAGSSVLRLRGVMAVAPLDAEPAEAFAELAAHAARVRSIVPDARWISAGMSADLEEAVAAGATHLRIGTAITGERPSGA